MSVAVTSILVNAACPGSIALAIIVTLLWRWVLRKRIFVPSRDLVTGAKQATEKPATGTLTVPGGVAFVRAGAISLVLAMMTSESHFGQNREDEEEAGKQLSGEQRKMSVDSTYIATMATERHAVCSLQAV